MAVKISIRTNGDRESYKDLVAGTGVTVTEEATQVVITASGGGGGDGANVKSGTIATSGKVGAVTFGTPFSSTPRVTITPQDSGLILRDCLWVIRSVSTTSFSFDVDADATYAWIATDAGNA